MSLYQQVTPGLVLSVRWPYRKVGSAEPADEADQARAAVRERQDQVGRSLEFGEGAIDAVRLQCAKGLDSPRLLGFTPERAGADVESQEGEVLEGAGAAVEVEGDRCVSGAARDVSLRWSLIRSPSLLPVSPT